MQYLLSAMLTPETRDKFTTAYQAGDRATAAAIIADYWQKSGETGRRALRNVENVYGDKS